MAKEIELPDGSIAEFPDTMSDEEIAAVLRRQFGAPEPAASAAPAQPQDPALQKLLAQREAALRDGKPDVAKRIEARIAGLQAGRGQVQQGAFGTGNVVDRAAAVASGNARQVLSTLGDVIAATLTYGGQNVRAAMTPEQDSISPGQAVSYERGRREGLTEQNGPLLNTALNIGGAVATAGPLARAVGGVLSRVPGLAGVGRALTPVTGQTGLNVVRTGAVAAAEGAASGAVDALPEGRTAEGAAFGAAFGAGVPVAIGLPTIARGVAEGVQNFTMPSRSAIRALARRLSTDVDTLQARFNAFLREQKRPPSVAELVNQVDVPELSTAIGQSRRGSLAANKAAEDARATRPQEVRDLVSGGREAVAPRAVQEEAADKLTQALGDAADPGALRNRRFSPSQKLLQFLDGADFAQAIAPLRSATLSGLMERLQTTGRLTVDEADALRQGLNSLADQAPTPQDAARLRGFTELVQQETARAVPKYGDALQDYALALQARDGILRGQKVLSEDAADFIAEQQAAANAAARRTEAAAAAEAAGVRQGARNALIAESEKSSRAATRLTQRLSDPAGGLPARLDSALGPGETARLVEGGGQLARSAENLEALVPVPIREANRALQESLKLGGAVGTVAARRASGGFIVSTATKLTQLVQMPPEVAYRMAQALLTPGRSQQVIAQLKAQGARDEAIAQVIRDVAVGLSVGAHAAVEE